MKRYKFSVKMNLETKVGAYEGYVLYCLSTAFACIINLFYLH